jgi:hypothetical protein
MMFSSTRISPNRRALGDTSPLGGATTVGVALARALTTSGPPLKWLTTFGSRLKWLTVPSPHRRQGNLDAGRWTSRKRPSGLTFNQGLAGSEMDTFRPAITS